MKHIFTLFCFVFTFQLLSQTWTEQQILRAQNDTITEMGVDLKAHDRKLLSIADGKVVYHFLNFNNQWVKKQIINIESAHGSKPNSVALYKNVAVIGCIDDNTDADSLNPVTSAGSAYIYLFKNDRWEYHQKIVSSNRGNGHYFGSEISIHESTIAVGEHRRKAAGGIPEGAVHLYKQDGNGYWSFSQKITPPLNPEERGFGLEVELKDTLLFVGAPLEQDGGAVYFYTFNNGNWNLKQIIYDNSLSGHENYALSISHQQDFLVVGAPKHDNPAGGNSTHLSGAVYLYRFENSTWVFKQKLTASDMSEGAYFGFSHTIKDNAIAIGSHLNHTGQNNSDSIYRSGGAYIFTYNNGTWSETQKLIPSTRGEQNYFGFGVTHLDNQFIVCAPAEKSSLPQTDPAYYHGSIYVFERPSDIGLKENLKNNLIVYPNPSTGIFNIPESNQSSHLEIYNAQGQKFSQLIHNNRIDLSKFPKGLYVLILDPNKTRKSAKIILE
ncbi:MAG: T9SS type A sorting domain-containing protein [Schleiferiaceae bacterium]|nr:T9SS type A sorting domain-containing protein [Schleiferiaceae bacterium]